MPKKPQLEPSIDLSDDPVRELKVNVRTSVLTLIGRYVEFYETVKGAKPDRARVVDQGLEKFFNRDEAFQDYLLRVATENNGSAKRAPAAPASANHGAGG